MLNRKDLIRIAPMPSWGLRRTALRTWFAETIECLNEPIGGEHPNPLSLQASWDVFPHGAVEPESVSRNRVAHSRRLMLRKCEHGLHGPNRVQRVESDTEEEVTVGYNRDYALLRPGDHDVLEYQEACVVIRIARFTRESSRHLVDPNQRAWRGSSAKVFYSN